MKSRLLATVIGLGILAGCGKAMPAAPTAWTPQTADSVGVQCAKHKKARLFAGLDLTERQKREIRAIFAKAHKDRKARQEDREAFRKLITAETIDRDALTAAIEAKLAKHADKIERKVTMLSAIREVLTDKQREKLAANIESMGKGRSMADRQRRIRDKMAKVAEQLKMTDVQKAKFDAVLDAYAAGSEARQERRADMKAAVAEFMTTGDEAELKSALSAAKPEVPVAAIVEALASLDQGQRKQMLAMHMRHHRGRMAMGCPSMAGGERMAASQQDEAKDDASSQEDTDEAGAEQVESGDGQGPDEDRGGEPQPEPQG